jgi:hypothetical protein
MRAFLTFNLYVTINASGSGNYFSILGFDPHQVIPANPLFMLLHLKGDYIYKG